MTLFHTVTLLRQWHSSEVGNFHRGITCVFVCTVNWPFKSLYSNGVLLSSLVLNVLCDKTEAVLSTPLVTCFTSSSRIKCYQVIDTGRTIQYSIALGIYWSWRRLSTQLQALDSPVSPWQHFVASLQCCTLMCPIEWQVFIGYNRDGLKQCHCIDWLYVEALRVY
jgi:hypothetical protein